MKRTFFTKAVLIVLSIAIIGFGLAGCITIPPINPPIEPINGSVQIVVSGTYTYDLTMDGTTRFSNKQPGTYTITNVPTGNHSFEAIVLSGDYSYNLKMDDWTYFSSKPEGTYTLTNVPIGNHTFEAIDTWGG